MYGLVRRPITLHINFDINDGSFGDTWQIAIILGAKFGRYSVISVFINVYVSFCVKFSIRMNEISAKMLKYSVCIFECYI